MLGRSIGDETVRASASTPVKAVMPFISHGEGKDAGAPESGASAKSSPAAETPKAEGASLGRGLQAGTPVASPQKTTPASPAGEKTKTGAPANEDTKKLARPATPSATGEGTQSTPRPPSAPAEDSKTLPRVIVNERLGAMALGSKKLGSPPPTAPVPAGKPAAAPAAAKAPDPGVAEVSASIERYAAIAAEIGMKGSDRSNVLKANGLSIASWADIDEKWADAIATALETDDRALVGTFDATYVATQERLGKRIGVVEYARILVGIERGEVGGVLASLELALSDLVRIQRVWAKKLAETPALGAEVEKAVDAIRSAPA
jgi:hypothetical protein